MIEKIGQVMLYVENQAAVRDFLGRKIRFCRRFRRSCKWRNSVD